MIQLSNEHQPKLNPEKVAYWYFRLNGFLQIENFYVHPSTGKNARTDADLLGVRFPHRVERLFDPGDIMQDDERGLSLSPALIDVIIAEVTRQPCKLNGPWTRPADENVHRVLAALGCFPRELIGGAAEKIYLHGHFEDANSLRLRARLVCVGRERSRDIEERYPSVTQVSWRDLLSFTFNRLRHYRNQKWNTQHWDHTGKMLKVKARKTPQEDDFINWVLECMGMRSIL